MRCQYRPGLGDRKTTRYILTGPLLAAPELQQLWIPKQSLLLSLPPSSRRLSGRRDHSSSVIFLPRSIGTIRRECLDYMIPLTEKHCVESFASGRLITIPDAACQPWARNTGVHAQANHETEAAEVQAAIGLPDPSEGRSGRTSS